MKLSPLGSRIIVKIIEKTETEKGGLIIPETVKEKPLEAIVIAAGKDNSVKEGEKVLFGKYSGIPFKLEDTSYLILHTEDVLGIVTE